MIGNDRTEENSEQLTTKQESLIALLLAGITITAAAKQLKVNESTARRWLKLPHVHQAYKDQQQTLFDDKLSELRSGVGTAISTLKRNMTSEDTTASVQVRAAQIWLEQALELHKMSELEQKIAELEQYVKQVGK